MPAFRGLIRSFDPRARAAQETMLAALEQSTKALRQEVQDTRNAVQALAARLETTHRGTGELVASSRRDVQARAALVRAAAPLTLAESIRLHGPAHRRLDLRRLTAGAPVETRFAAWMGVTHCVTPSSNVRGLWDGLLAAETEASGGVLRSAPSAALDVGPARISRGLRRTADVVLLESEGPYDRPIVAVPRVAYDATPHKLRNFGHWLLDCVTQVVALAAIAPDAIVLLPPDMARFHRESVRLAGIPDARIHVWDGAPISAGRMLLFEHDGRASGGRPLSPLLMLRDIVRASLPPGTGRRRLYISRRDARAKRRWVSNEPAIERLFASRGFEILVMADCPLDEQVRAFGHAHIVAGVSGGGLSDIVFAPPGTHLIVLQSDSLMEWYADPTGTRSRWRRDNRRPAVELAAFGDSPRFYAHLAAALSQHCHSFLSADDVPLPLLEAFVDEVLARAGTGA